MILPNQLTILRIILSPVFLYLFLSDYLLFNIISVMVYIIAALSDWYDGWLARKFNYITSWGKFWDPLADKILTSAAFIGFAIVELVPYWMVVIIVGRDILITLLRVYADKKGFKFSTSFYAKWKTLLQMVYLYYLLIVFVAGKIPEVNQHYGKVISNLLDANIVYFVTLLITLITLHSGILYLRRNWPIIKKLYK
ncbi:MAG: CDP-diacylglycerol--glycerol-3-phosphate 3-phosphatidyltransferase [Ignavibacteriaceae bacterium]|nr:CDP-diacylglycerol--glycerol-3-phosphate 3-phosphatidyltransferase [Ignavibacteriaceae bacterium]